MIEKPIRHLQRYKDIIVAFSRNGLGFLLKQLGLHNLRIIPKSLYKSRNPNAEEKTLGERIRLILEELGPTFIKVGQMASTRPDIIPAEIIRELEKLQTHVPPFPYQKAKEIIEAELDAPIEAIFAKIDPEPLAAASIGQVHLGVLKTGEQVAVKVQRPNIQEKIETDFEILKELATLAELKLDWAIRYRARDVVKEFSNMIRLELDYIIEGRNAERIATQLEDDDLIKIPEVITELSTSKVLVMEYIDGVKLSDVMEDKVVGYDKKAIADHIARTTFHQVLIDGFFHADPHPGNILVRPNNQLVLLDFGMVGRLTEKMKEQFGILLICMMKEDNKGIVDQLLEMGVAPEDIDVERLENDVELFMDKYYRARLSEISLSDMVREIFTLAHKYKIELSPDYTILGKTLLTLEGTISQLDPDLSIVEIAKTYGQKLIRERYRPKKVVNKMIGQISEYVDLFSILPRQLKKLSGIIKGNKLRLEINFSDLDSLLRKMDRISNQLSFAIVLLAFSIIMVGLIIGSALAGQPSVLWSLPAIKIGSVVALFLFLWLLYAIFKSGRF